MSHDFRPEFARGGALPFPLFLECDRAGDVVWMSDTSRHTLEAAEGLSTAIPGLARFAASQPLQGGESVALRFSLVLAMPNSLLYSAEVQSNGVYTQPPEVLGMLRLLRSMIRNILHLQNIHMRLAARVMRRRRGSGRQVVEHLEKLRRRLAIDLHTGVGQHLTAIGLQLDSLERAQLPLPAPAPAALAAIRRSLEDARQETRGLSHQLNPPEWQVLTVREALDQLWRTSGFAQTLEDNATIYLSEVSVEPSQTFKAVLYRAAQEALKNVAEHAEATQVNFSFTQTEEGYSLVVEDDGKGFDLEEILRKPATLDKGIGLSSIRDLVSSNGGEFRVKCGDGKTRVEVILPLRDPGEE